MKVKLFYLYYYYDSNYGMVAAAISLRLQGKLSFPYNCQKMNGQIYVLYVNILLTKMHALNTFISNENNFVQNQLLRSADSIPSHSFP